jgi:prevent-host-death family protein
MPAGEFKAKCLAVMDEVQASGEAVIVTKRGKPVARVTPVEKTSETSGAPSSNSPRPSNGSRKPLSAENGFGTKESIFGRLRHTGVIRGDIVSSDLSNEEWDRMFDEKWARFEKGSSE